MTAPTILAGDCLDVIRTLPDCSIDAVVTDPPYGLEFMSVAWDTFADRPKGSPRVRNEWEDFGSREHPRNATEAARIAGKKNTAFYEFSVLWAREVYRVLKPGGHCVAFSGSRTYHRMACAIEDAGFEIRDQLQWLYGTGFPKSHDVSKGIDKAGGNPLVWRSFSQEYAKSVAASAFTHADIDKFLGIKSSSCYWARTDHRGDMPPRCHWDRVSELLSLPSSFAKLYDAVEREVVSSGRPKGKSAGIYGDFAEDEYNYTAPATDAAREWAGWGTALKPANEPICLARKPLSEGTVAANCLRWGTGALNIDATRVEGPVPSTVQGQSSRQGEGYGHDQRDQRQFVGSPLGRWPANVLHDGSPEVVAMFPETHAAWNGGPKKVSGADQEGNRSSAYGKESRKAGAVTIWHGGDSGSAARFFYSAKASKADRANSKHPTVKPVSLMRWLVRLVTPSGGTILDPFAGSGTTGAAALAEGFDCVLIEREAEYLADIRRRFGLRDPVEALLEEFL